MKKKTPFLLAMLSVLLFSCNPVDEQEKEENNYAEWPTTLVNDWTSIVCPGTEVVIPSFNKATEIEVDTSYYLEEGYFGIYCYTEDSNSENEYKQILTQAGWSIDEEKVESYFNGFSSDEEIWINFAWNEQYKDLEIYINAAPLISWPTQKIANAVEVMYPGATDVVPSFEATSYVATYYSGIKRLAINGYGTATGITNTYKTTLTNAGWSIEDGNGTNDYNAVSPNNQLEINFYYDTSKAEFNVDVSAHNIPVTSWPTIEIESLVSFMGCKGTIEEYTGENLGFAIDLSFYPYAIYVYVSSEQAATSGAEAYNQSLLNKGYSQVAEFYGDPVYSKEGYTIGYRAVHLNGKVVTIELIPAADYEN